MINITMPAEGETGGPDTTIVNPDPAAPDRSKATKGPKNRSGEGKGPDKTRPAAVADTLDREPPEALPIVSDGAVDTDASDATEDDALVVEGADSPETEASPRTTERIKDEVSLIITRTLLSEATRRLKGPDGQPRMPEDQEEGRLFAAQQILTRERAPGDANILEFKKSADSTHDLWMPTRINAVNRAGLTQSFAGGMVRLAGMIESTSDGRIVCYLEGKDGNVIQDSAGADETGDSRIKITLTREEILRMQMHSEKDGYEGFFPGESQQIFRASMGEAPMDESLDPAIEAAANAADMLTAADVQTRITKFFPDTAKMPDPAKAVLKSLEGKTVITKQDFLDAMSLGANPLEQFAKSADAISTEITELKNGDPENAPAAARLEQLLAQQQLINTAYEAFKKASAEGKDPFDAYFDKVQNGQLTPEQAKAFIQAFRAGNDDAIADQIVDLQIKEGMTDGEKADVATKREVFKTALKAGEIAGSGIGIAAFLLLILGSAVIQMAPALAGGGGRR